MTPPKDSGKLVGMINDHYRESQGAIVGASISAHKVVLLEQGEIGGIPYAMNWTFYAHSPRIDWHCDLTLDNQWIGRARIPVAAGAPAPEQAEGDRPETTTAWNDHEHKLRLRFYPFIKPWATGVRDLPFHIAETSDPYVEGLTWGAVTDGEVGLAFLNRGLMGSIREKDDSFSNILAFSLPYVWGTRPLRGTYRYDLAILPFEGPWQEANLHKLALEYNAPVISRSEEVQGDPLGDAWTPYQETGDGRALLSALYTKNGATYARFYEYQGQTADVGVNWMGRAARLTSVNLREQRQARLGARARLGPWQVQTLELEGT
jgi:hypothetical protein